MSPKGLTSLQLAKYSQKTFFCEKLGRELTYNECQELFIFSNVFKTNREEAKEISTETACYQCPFGNTNRRIFSGLPVKIEKKKV